MMAYGLLQGNDSSDQSDDNRVPVDQSGKDDNNHLISILNEVPLDQGDNNHVLRSPAIVCGISLKNLVWKVLPRVLMMKAVNPEFFFRFAMNWNEDDKKFSALSETTVV
jgi:hypothetical protein